MRNIQSVPSSRAHARVGPGGTVLWGPPLAPSSSYGLVQQRGDILFLVPVGRAEDHHSILDRECVEVVQHDVVGLREQSWITRNPRVLVQDDLEQMRRENGWCFKPFFWF